MTLIPTHSEAHELLHRHPRDPLAPDAATRRALKERLFACHYLSPEASGCVWEPSPEQQSHRARIDQQWLATLTPDALAEVLATRASVQRLVGASARR